MVENTYLPANLKMDLIKIIMDARQKEYEMFQSEVMAHKRNTGETFLTLQDIFDILMNMGYRKKPSDIDASSNKFYFGFTKCEKKNQYVYEKDDKDF